MAVTYGIVAGITKAISRIVQGTMWFRADAVEAAHAVLDQAYALGVTTFDSAHVYGGGESERILGRWIEERGVRDKVVIVGKGGEPNPDRARVTPFDLSADMYDSLARLRTSSIDLYLVHVDDPSVAVGPIVEAMNGHLAAGRISAYGVSNWSHERIAAANAYAHEHGLQPIVASSVHLSLAEQVRPPWPGNLSIGGESGRDAREWYRSEGMPVFAWSALAAGFFSGRFRPDNRDTFDAYFDQIAAATYSSDPNFARLARARDLGAERGLSAAQVALAWVLGQPIDVYALVGSATPQEVRDNVQATQIELCDDDLARLSGVPITRR